MESFATEEPQSCAPVSVGEWHAQQAQSEPCPKALNALTESLPALADEKPRVEPLFLPGKIDLSTLALEIARKIGSGARSMIEACILLDNGTRLCEADDTLRDQFVRA